MTWESDESELIKRLKEPKKKGRFTFVAMRTMRVRLGDQEFTMVNGDTLKYDQGNEPEIIE